MLTECIDPGTTLSNLVWEAYSKYDTEDADEIAHLDRLEESGERVVNALYGKFVVHNDLAGRNMVVSDMGEDERLVVVDFDCAMVMGRDQGRFANSVKYFRAAFKPEPVY